MGPTAHIGPCSPPAIPTTVRNSRMLGHMGITGVGWEKHWLGRRSTWRGADVRVIHDREDALLRLTLTEKPAPAAVPTSEAAPEPG